MYCKLQRSMAPLMLLLTGSSLAQLPGKPLVIGQQLVMQSSSLQEVRTINVYLPEGYNPHDTITYPLIVLPDGGLKEDFLHIAGLVQYASQPWVNRLSPSIVVGIENTNRKRDFTFPVNNIAFLKEMGYSEKTFPSYGGSTKYIAFLQNELIPFLRKNFKASGRRTLIGESLAGLLATEILFRHPDLFDTFIIVSPALWWDAESLLDSFSVFEQKISLRSPSVYIGAPSKDEEARMYADATTLYERIRSLPGVRVVFDYLPQESHATVFHQAVYNAFKLLSSEK